MAEEVTEKQQQDKTVTEQVTMIEHKSKTGIWVTIIVLLIVLLAGVGFYLLQQLRDKQEAQSSQLSKEDQRAIGLQEQITNTQALMTAMQAQLATFGADVTGTDDVFNKKLADFSEKHDEKLETKSAELKRNILQLQRQLGKTRGDWLMADAEYLLSVANQRLRLTGDLKTTFEALEAADQRLLESGDAAAFPVREQIAKEKAAIESLTANDLVGNYAILQLLIDKVEGLALISPYANKPLTSLKAVHNHSKKSDSSHSIVDMALKQVKGYVTIRHTDKPIDKVLTPIQAKLIKQQLSIKLEIVKIALVQQNTELYKASITDTMKWLDTHFIKNEAAKVFITKFNALNSLQIRTELPDISLSLKMLRDISKLRMETDKALETDKITETPTSTEPITEEAVTTEQESTVDTTNEAKKDSKETEEQVKPSSDKEEKDTAVDTKSEEKKEIETTEEIAKPSTDAKIKEPATVKEKETPVSSTDESNAETTEATTETPAATETAPEQ